MAACRLRSAPESKDLRSYELKSRDGGRHSRSDRGGDFDIVRNRWEKRGREVGRREDSERGRKWLRWNFEPRRNPGPDPNWPSQAQVIHFAILHFKA